MRYDNIQLIRLVAALGVALHHLAHYAVVSFGANYYTLWPLRWSVLVSLPVPLFFAVSGFVLSRALDVARVQTPATRAGQFLIARALRLYPGYWLAVALAAGAFALTRPPAVLKPMAEFRPVALALVPAGRDATSYLLAVEWSLIYELFLSVALGVLSLLGPKWGMPLAAALWLTGLGAKAVIAPGLGTAILPDAATIALSAYCAPFLGGALVYSARGIGGRRSQWLAGVVALGAWWWVTTADLTPELFWLGATLPASLIVWLAVRRPQVPPGNRLARLGDRTYGLYLIHVPLLMVGFHLLSEAGFPRSNLAGVIVVGVATITLGLQFGRLEHWLHLRLRRLTGARRVVGNRRG